MTAEPDLKTKADVHLARKIWHFIGVVVVAIFYHNLSRPMALQTLTFLCAVGIFIDVYRQKAPWLNKLVVTLGQHIMRESEKAGLAGSTYLLVGVLVIVAIFPPSVVLLSLLFLAVADPIASYFGIRYGKDKLFGKKSLQGSMAAFFACTIVAAIYFLTQGMMTERILIVSILAGLIGAVAEVIPVADLDDNFVLPVVSSCLLWVVYYFFGGF
jgi:diacylglycerol kinase (CTP)